MKTAARSLAAGLVALAGAGALDLWLADRALQRPYDVVHVPSGAAARVVALGHRTFLSDLYWLSTVQYVGDPRAADRGYDKLYPLVDLVTDLDPRHGYAYQTAGIVLSANGRLDESNRILEKGIERGPRWWTFPFYVAFNHWFYEGDYAKGAEWAERAARTPGASTNLSQLALSLRAKTGRPEDAIEMIREIRRNVLDEKSAAALEEQLKLAVLERDAQALEREVARFRSIQGRDPFSLEELVVAGLVAAIPTDPFGGRYVWDRSDGKVHSSANPFRFQLREGPRRPAGFLYEKEKRP